MNAWVVRGVLFALAYAAAAELGHALSFPGHFASFWPPAGVYLATLLVTDPRRWPVLIVAALSANLASDLLFHGTAIPVSVGFSVVNALEAVSGAWLLRRVVGAPFRLSRVYDVVALMLSILCSTALSALMGATVVTTAFGGNYWASWQIWCSADLVGALIFTPLIVITLSEGSTLIRAVRAERLIEVAAAFLLLTIVAQWVFGSQTKPLMWVLFPILLWLAIRFETAGLSAANCLVALIAGWHSSHGRGPLIADLTIGYQVMMIQAFLSVVAFSFLILSVLVSERRVASAKLAESERRFRLLVELVQDYAIFMLDSDGRVVTWNLGARRITGWESREIIGQHFSRFYVDTAIPPYQKLAIAKVEGRFEETGWQVRRDGSRFWANDVIVPLYDEDKRFRGFSEVTCDLTERRNAALNTGALSVALHQGLGELQDALDHVSSDVDGPVAICAWCKRVRDDRNTWQAIEAYLAGHTDIPLGYSICPICSQKLEKEVESEKN